MGTQRQIFSLQITQDPPKSLDLSPTHYLRNLPLPALTPHRNVLQSVLTDGRPFLARIFYFLRGAATRIVRNTPITSTGRGEGRLNSRFVFSLQPRFVSTGDCNTDSRGKFQSTTRSGFTTLTQSLLPHSLTPPDSPALEPL